MSSNNRPRRPDDDLEDALEYADLVQESLDDAAGRLQTLEDLLRNAALGTDGARANKISILRGIAAGARHSVLHLKVVVESTTKGVVKVRDEVLADNDTTATEAAP